MNQGIEFPFAVKHGIFIFGNLDFPEECELGIWVPKSHIDCEQAQDDRNAYLNEISSRSRKRDRRK